MKLTFLGTRGYIDERTPRHRMHASLRAEYRGKWVMVDCGEDWLDEVDRLRPRAIVITHAHPTTRAGSGTARRARSTRRRRPGSGWTGTRYASVGPSDRESRSRSGG